MLSDSHVLGDEVCPVREEFLGELYSASKLDMPIVVTTLPADTKALLALFCYRRSHLRALGLAIAAACDEDDLVRSGGRLGTDLFAKSRETPQKTNGAKANRRNITLATGTLRNMSPIDEEPEEELRDSVALVNCAQTPDVLDQGSFTSRESITSESLRNNGNTGLELSLTVGPIACSGVLPLCLTFLYKLVPISQWIRSILNTAIAVHASKSNAELAIQNGRDRLDNGISLIGQPNCPIVLQK